MKVLINIYKIINEVIVALVAGLLDSPHPITKAAKLFLIFKISGSDILDEVVTHLTNDDLEKLIVISQDSMVLEECKEYNPNIKIKHIETQKSLIEKLKSTVEKIRHFFTRKRGTR